MRYYFQQAIVCLIYRLFYIPGSGQTNDDLSQISFEDNPFEMVNSILYDTLEWNALCQEVALEQSALYQTGPW